jgi:hypothetical protein
VILERVVLKNNGSDLTYVQSLLNASSVTTILRDSTALPSLTRAALIPFTATNDTALAILQLLGNLYEANPPYNINTKETITLRKTLFQAGIYSGSYHQPPGINLSQAYDEVVASVQQYAIIGLQPFNNGWYHNIPQTPFGADYLDRAFIAAVVYLEQTAEQALYPSRQTRTMQLGSNESYIYTFSRKPPVVNDGFWSLTLYNSEGFLVGNELNKYEVGDRSDITYADGTTVYGRGNSSQSDGPFEVLVQAANMIPPENWTSK